MTLLREKRAEQLLMRLLELPGCSGEEGEVMAWLVDQLRQGGVPADSIEFDEAHRRSRHGGRVGNLACRLPGTRRGARRMLLAHADTVPLCRGVRPVRRGDSIAPAASDTALGADDRAGCAVLLATALEVVRGAEPHPPLTFLWTVQEETGLHGAKHVRLGMLGRPRMAFNFDGGPAERVTVGATGGYRIEIDVTGLAAHAGVAPEEGVNAITVASLAIARLHRDGWLGLVERDGRRGTSNIGVIRGGDATNVVTPHVRLRAEARSHDPRFRGRIVRAIQRAFRDAARMTRNREGAAGRVRFDGRLDYEAFKLPDNEPAVLAAEAAVRAIGGEPVRAVSNGGLDANWLTARGIPTVSLGCGQVHVHTTAERMNLVEFRKACAVAMQLARAE